MAFGLEDDAFLAMLTLVHSDILAHEAAGGAARAICELPLTACTRRDLETRRSLVRRLTIAALVTAAAAALALGGPAAAAFAPAATAPVRPGTLAFNSRRTMQAKGEKDPTPASTTTSAAGARRSAHG